MMPFDFESLQKLDKHPDRPGKVADGKEKHPDHKDRLDLAFTGIYLIMEWDERGYSGSCKTPRILLIMPVWQ
jgi:hypothetical protein